MASQQTSPRAQHPAASALVARARDTTLDERVALLAGLLAILARLPPLGAYSTEFDEGVYWQSLRAMAAGHPLFSAVFSSQPPAFLLSIYPFYIALGQSLPAARFGVAVYSLLGPLALYITGRVVAGRWAGVLAGILLAFDPLYLTESYTLQAEAPALGMLALAVMCAALAHRAAGSRRHWLALAAGATLGLGTMIKLFDVVGIVPVICFLITSPLAATVRQFRLGSGPSVTTNISAGSPAPPGEWPGVGARGVVRGPSIAPEPVLDPVCRDRWTARVNIASGACASMRQALLAVASCAAGIVAAGVLVLVPFAARWDALYSQVVTYHLAAAHAVNAGLRANVVQLVAVLGADGLAPLALLALALALLLRRPHVGALLVAGAWAFGALLLLVRQQPLFAHDITLAAPPFALLGALALDALLRAPAATALRVARVAIPERTLGRALVGIVLAVTVLGGLRGVATAVARAPYNDIRMALALEAATAPGDTVVTDDPYVAALADCSVPPQLVDTSAVRIESGLLTASQLEALITRTDARTILLASGRFALLPGFRAWVVAHFQQAANFGDGRVLYTKAPQGPIVA